MDPYKQNRMTGLEPKYVDWLLHGFEMTLVLSAAACAAATVMGFIVAMMRNARRPALSRVASLYVLIFRNAPLVVQLLFWYFGAATLLPQDWTTWLNTPHAAHIGGIKLAWPSFEFIAAWFGLTIYTTAFISEEFRAGIRGVPEGQYHAAAALGLTPLATFRHVVLPQAIRIAMPSVVGQYMNAVKNSSLAMAIGFAELSYMSRQVDTETFKTFQAFGVATVLYVATIAVMEIALIAWQRTRRTAWRGARA
jgi:polar amino acid transport system permease protein